MNNSTWIKESFLLFVLMIFYGIAQAQTAEPFTLSIESEQEEGFESKAFICMQNYEKEGCKIKFTWCEDQIELSDGRKAKSNMVFLEIELNLNKSFTNGDFPAQLESGNIGVEFELDDFDMSRLHKIVRFEKRGQTIVLQTNTHGFKTVHDLRIGNTEIKGNNEIDADTFLSLITKRNIHEVRIIILGKLTTWGWELNVFKTAPTIKAMMQRIVAEQGKNGSSSNSNSGENAKIDWRTHMRKIADNATDNYNNGKYKGQKSNGLRHGLGAYFWNDGSDYYFGEWSNGIKHGCGILIAGDGGRIINNCSNCVYYVGNYSNDDKLGKGSCYDNDGNLIYFGNFSNDAPTETYPTTGNYSSYKFECIEYDNGNKYIGETKDGKRHGRGIYIWKNGDAWYGPWEDGIRKGFGIEMYYNGSIKYGRWSNDTYYEK